MSISFGFHPIALIVALALSAVLTLWTYSRSVPQVSRPLRSLLTGLRFSALAIILFLLAEPVVRSIRDVEHNPVLAVLVDASQSMALRDEGSLVDLRGATLDVLSRLPVDLVNGRTVFYAFDQDLRSLDPDVPFDSLRFEGTRTDIARSLSQLRDRHREDHLGGVLLVSDGQYNTGRNPLYLADEYPVPIHTLVVGDTTERRDVQVYRVMTNDLAYSGVELPIRVGIRAQGFAEQAVSVTLFRQGERLSSTAITLPQGSTEKIAEMAYVPAQPGLHRLTATVNRLDGEFTFENNAESFTIRVLESKQRVLVLASSPGPDLSSLRTMLEDNVDLQLDVRTQRSIGAFYEGPLPDSLARYDLIVSLGYPGFQSDQSSAERVARTVAGGTPLLFVLGRNTHVARLNDLFGDLLPVRPVSVRQGYVEAAFDVTSTGAIHPVLSMPEGVRPVWQALPPLAYNESLWEPSPDARVLATIRVRNVPLQDPLLAIRRRSGGRSAALLGAGTWRWSNVPEDLEVARELWPTLFSNLIQWLTAREDDRPVRVQPQRMMFGGGEPVEFTGQVYDESLRPVSDAVVDVEISTPQDEEFSYSMEPIGGGRYMLDVGSLPEGSYRYSARASRQEVSLGTDTGEFAVGRLTLEFKETRANGALMRQLARRSRGTPVNLQDLNAIVSAVNESPEFTTVTTAAERTSELWRNLTFLVIALSLLSIEWALRKRSGMI